MFSKFLTSAALIALCVASSGFVRGAEDASLEAKTDVNPEAKPEPKPESKPTGIVPPAKPEEVELSKPDADGWVSLFDGKTFTGWYGDPKVWRLENGYISGKIGSTPTNTFLIFNHPFSNFVLEAKCMLIKGKGFTNSGIQYRSTVTKPEKWMVHGYQADMGDEFWGANYEEGMRGLLWSPAPDALKAVKPFNEWNTYVITCDGINIKQELNGVVSGQLADKSPQRQLSGIIALQYHAPGKDFETRFKDIRIKILPDTEVK